MWGAGTLCTYIYFSLVPRIAKCKRLQWAGHLDQVGVKGKNACRFRVDKCLGKWPNGSPKWGFGRWYLSGYLGNSFWWEGLKWKVSGQCPHHVLFCHCSL